jgi:hypothetical protein
MHGNGRGVGPGADFRHGRVGLGADFGRGWVGLGAGWRRGCVGPGANSSCAQGCGHEHSILMRTKGKLRAAIAVGTHVCAQTGATSGAGVNGRVLERGRAHAATGAGDINKSSPILVICQSLFQAPCPSTPSALCKELWCESLAFKLVGGALSCIVYCVFAWCKVCIDHHVKGFRPY